MPVPGSARRAEEAAFETVLTVVDADGIDALAVRRVATELNVDPMALYRHVDGKDALLDGALEVLWRDVSPPRESPARWAVSLRSADLMART